MQECTFLLSTDHNISLPGSCFNWTWIQSYIYITSKVIYYLWFYHQFRHLSQIKVIHDTLLTAWCYHVIIRINFYEIPVLIGPFYITHLNQHIIFYIAFHWSSQIITNMFLVVLISVMYWTNFYTNRQLPTISVDVWFSLNSKLLSTIYIVGFLIKIFSATYLSVLVLLRAEENRVKFDFLTMIA